MVTADVSIRYHYVRKQLDNRKTVPKETEIVTNRYGFLETDENGNALKKYKLSVKDAWKRYELERDRAKRWNIMIVNWDSWVKNKKSRLKKRIGKGLPDSLRGEAWKKLTNSDKSRKEKSSLYQVRFFGNI
jgi:hypothetical protein